MIQIPLTITRMALKAQKYAPELMVAGGIVSGVVCTVTACKASTKAGAILDEIKEERDKIDRVVAFANDKENHLVSVEEYSPKDRNKDLAIVYSNGALKLAKNYAIPIAFGVLSVALILSGTGILKKRNALLTAAYTTLDAAFNKYRENVVKDQGEDADFRYLTSSTVEKVSREEVDPETGKKHKVKEEATVIGPDGMSRYARLFDECNSDAWERHAGLNKAFLNAQMSQLNDKLIARGHLFLNEVYDALGFERSPEGSIVGWIYDPYDETRENVVNFILKDVYKQEVVDFINDREPNVWIDFRPDGIIWNLI